MFKEPVDIGKVVRHARVFDLKKAAVNDIATLMQRYRPDTAALLAPLRAYLNATDMAAVEGIIGEIQQRIERFERRL